MMEGLGVLGSSHTPLPKHTQPGQLRKDRAVSYRKSRWAVPSVTIVYGSGGPSVPPSNTVSVSPAPSTPLQEAHPERTSRRSPSQLWGRKGPLGIWEITVRTSSPVRSWTAIRRRSAQSSAPLLAWLTQLGLPVSEESPYRTVCPPRRSAQSP